MVYPYEDVMNDDEFRKALEVEFWFSDADARDLSNEPRVTKLRCEDHVYRQGQLNVCGRPAKARVYFKDQFLNVCGIHRRKRLANNRWHDVTWGPAEYRQEYARVGYIE